MKVREFEDLKDKFISSNLEKKIEIYKYTEELTLSQYKELLRNFPYSEIGKLEKSLA